MNQIKIPYSLLPPPLLLKSAKMFYTLAEKLEPKFPRLKQNLVEAEFPIDSIRYLALCMASSFFTMIFFLLIAIIISNKVKFFISLIVIIFFMFIIFSQQVYYPKLAGYKRIKTIDKDLLPFLENMLIQLNSGVPLFNILISISQNDYGMISKEIGEAVKEINAGKAAADALDDIASRNPSPFFRRSLWQIVNGMKTGTELSVVLKDLIQALGDSQLIQIEKYGGQLKPLAMFYLLFAIIMPALGTTFIILLSSFIAVSDGGTKVIFYGLYTLVLFFQFMFLGVIKSRRPSLLG